MSHLQDATTVEQFEPIDIHCCHMGNGYSYKASCVRPG